jgi:hypothetical protein
MQRITQAIASMIPASVASNASYAVSAVNPNAVSLKLSDEMGPGDFGILLKELGIQLLSNKNEPEEQEFDQKSTGANSLKNHFTREWVSWSEKREWEWNSVLDFNKDNGGNALSWKPAGGLKYFIVDKEYSVESKSEKIKQRFVVFSVTKDSYDQHSAPNLYNIYDVLEAFLKDHKHPPGAESGYKTSDMHSREFFLEQQKQGAIFLFPLYQNSKRSIPLPSLPLLPDRLEVPLSKDHIVLVSFGTVKKNLRLIDTQAGIPTIAYDDGFGKLQKQGLITLDEPLYLGMQGHKHLCGFGGFQCLFHIIETGNLDALVLIVLDPSIIKSKKYFLEHWKDITRGILAKIGPVQVQVQAFHEKEIEDDWEDIVEKKQEPAKPSESKQEVVNKESGQSPSAAPKVSAVGHAPGSPRMYTGAPVTQALPGFPMPPPPPLRLAPKSNS